MMISWKTVQELKTFESYNLNQEEQTVLLYTLQWHTS